MKRAIIREPHVLDIMEESIPSPKSQEVLLAVKTVGICGSDLHVFEGRHPFVEYPVLPGHEISGEIVDVGEALDSTLIGKKAVIEPSIPRGKLPRFEPGRYNISNELRVMGFQAPGAMTEYFAAPLDNIHVLPDDFSYVLGAMVEPTAVAVHGVRLAGTVAGMDVAVVGAGTIGLLVAQVARAYGAARIHVMDSNESRRNIATFMGFDTVTSLEDNAYEVVFECVGNGVALTSAIQSTRKGGTVIILGVFGDEVKISAGLIQDWELKLQGSLMYVSDDYSEAIRLLGSQHVRIDKMITHRYPLVEVHNAFAKALERGDVLKVVLENG